MNNSQNISRADAVRVLILEIVIICYLTVCHGFVFSKLWLWFIVSTFGLCELGIAQSAGIVLGASFATFKGRIPERGFRTPTEIAALAIYPWMTLLTGYIIKCFL